MGRCFPVYMVRFGTLARLLLSLDALIRERCSACAQEFKECLTTFPDKNKCKDLSDDYMECLHHKKEVEAKRHTSTPVSMILSSLSSLGKPRAGANFAY